MLVYIWKKEFRCLLTYRPIQVFTYIWTNAGVCCASLDDYKALMKMGLGLVLVGHVNFLLGALVHGAVLRHINVHVQARHMEYAISNVIALVSGLLVKTSFVFRPHIETFE